MDYDIINTHKDYYNLFKEEIGYNNGKEFKNY